MKKIFFALAACCIMAVPAFASGPYWTVEITPAPQSATIVRFYSATHQQLMEKKIAGKRLQICRKAVRRQLNKDLERFMRQYQMGQALSFLNTY